MANSRSMTVTQLLTQSFRVVRTDTVVLFPSLIVAFLLALNGDLLQGLFVPDRSTLPSGKALLFLLLATALNLFAQAMTIILVAETLDEHDRDIAGSFTRSLKRFPVLAGLMLLCVTVAGGLALLTTLLPKTVGTVLSIPMTFLFMTFFQLLPVVIMLEQAPFFGHLRITAELFRYRFQELLRYFLVIMLFGIGAVMLSAPIGAEGIPAPLKKLVPPVLQGLSGALTIIVSVILYRSAKRRVNTNA